MVRRTGIDRDVIRRIVIDRDVIGRLVIDRDVIGRPRPGTVISPSRDLPPEA